MNATCKYLLEGSYYAILQCGRLVNSAAILYKSGDYSTAIGLAALAHEELGRSRYLREQRKKVVEGKTVSIKEIKAACEDHVTKQEWGQIGLGQRFLVNSRLGKLIEVKHHTQPSSKEYQEASEELDEIAERQRSRTLQNRHVERMKAFYVEPNDLGAGWNKPWEKDKETAQYFLENAINDYGVQRNNAWVLDIIKLDDPELAQAIGEWIERPTLPPPPSLY